MTLHSTIQSKRLFLRPLQLEDAHIIFNYSSDPVANKFQGRIPKTVEETSTFIRNLEPEFGIDKTWFQLGIIEKENEKLIGDIGIHFVDNSKNHVEFGVSLSASKQGNGFAQEALQSLIDYLIEYSGTKRFTVSIDPRNSASIRLIEKLGFKRIKLNKKAFELRGEWVDDATYSLLAN